VKGEICRLGRLVAANIELDLFIGFAYQGKDIVFGFILEYSSLIDFGP